ncbi:hypothetical protein [Luteimonas abyssi]|uniref:hypothetical protein n=1 Tax=Luteimonas abyssi TaxID=1247514 RepID=UPI000737BAC4|nr:hypothetical protein [Luteimonas abyssi]
MIGSLSTSAGSATGDRVPNWLPPLALFVIGMWLVPLAQTCQLACVPGDLGDARFNGIVLEHFYRWLTGQETSLFNLPFYHPMPGTLTFSDNHWGTAWIYSIYRALGWDRYGAFSLWYLTGFAANFVVSHVVFRKMGFSSLASAVAAFAFTFAMPVLARHGHAQLTYRFLIPVGLLLWQRFAADGGWRWLAGLALAVAGQFYISIYLGYFMLLLLAAWAIAQWHLEGVGPRAWFAQWRRWRQPDDRRELVASVVAIALAGIALMLLMYPYLHYSELYAFQRSLDEIMSMTPRLRSYLLADESGLWEPLSSRIGAGMPAREEQQMFFGVGIVGLAVLGRLFSPLAMRRVASRSFVLLFILTITIGGISLYSLVANLPGADSVRAVARIGLVMILPLSILVAMGVDALHQRSSAARWAIVVLAGLMVVESATLRITNYDPAYSQARVDQLRAALPDPLPEDAVLFNQIHPGVPFHIPELDTVILAQEVGRPTLNGYSGNTPSGYGPRSFEIPCAQAQARMRGALDSGLVSAETVKALEESTLVVIGSPPCGPMSAPIMRISDAVRLSLDIASVEKLPNEPGYRVRVVALNPTEAPMNVDVDLPYPVRLSWQIVNAGDAVTQSAWTPRVDLSGGPNLAPGEVREMVFTVPDPGQAGARVVVSAVLEGRVWLHEHGLAMAESAIGGGQP